MLSFYHCNLHMRERDEYYTNKQCLKMFKDECYRTESKRYEHSGCYGHDMK